MSLELLTFLLILGLSSSVASLINEKSCKKVCVTVSTCTTGDTHCDDLTGPKYSKCQIKCNRNSIIETIEKIELNNLFSSDEKPNLEPRNGVIDDEELRDEFKDLLRVKLNAASKVTIYPDLFPGLFDANSKEHLRNYFRKFVSDENIPREKTLDVLGVLDKTLGLLNSPLEKSRRIKRTLPLSHGGGMGGGLGGRVGGTIGGTIGVGPGGVKGGITGGGSAEGYTQGMVGAGGGLGNPGYGYPVAQHPGYPLHPGMAGGYGPQYYLTEPEKKEESK